MANAELKFFTQILLAIMFTTNSYVKYRMLHVMRDADHISRVKTGELHPDVLIADVIKRIEFSKMNVVYLIISYGDLYLNFACSIVLQISCIMEKIKKFSWPEIRDIEPNVWSAVDRVKIKDGGHQAFVCSS